METKRTSKVMKFTMTELDVKDKSLKREVKLRLLLDLLLFYLQLLCQLCIAILASVSTYVLCKGKKDEAIVINSFITFGAIVIGALGKIQKENKISLNSTNEKRIEIAEAIRDLEIILDPKNKAFIERWFEIKIDLIKIDKRLVRKKNVLRKTIFGQDEQDTIAEQKQQEKRKGEEGGDKLETIPQEHNDQTKLYKPFEM